MVKFIAVVFVIVSGCKSQAVSEGSCNGDELDRLQTTCLGAGGSFSADTYAGDLKACEFDADGNPIGGSGSADCAMKGEGNCSIVCELNDDGGADYSECWQDGKDACAADLDDGGMFGTHYTRTDPTTNGEIVGTDCDVGYYCGWCQCWYVFGTGIENPQCDAEFNDLCD